MVVWLAAGLRPGADRNATRTSGDPMLCRALALTPILALVGCFHGPHLPSVSTDAGFVDITEDIHTVVIEVETGEVELVPGEPAGAVVDWQTQWKRSCPDIDVFAEDGVLYVYGHCPMGAWHCSTDFQIQVPAWVEVEAEVTTGSISLEQVTDVRAELTTGELNVRQATGDLELDVTTGGIFAYDLAAEDVDAKVVTGSLELELETEFDRVEAEVITGDITMGVPAGCYDMDLDVVTGDISTDNVSCDCSAGSEIRASVITGTIDIFGE